MKQAGWSVFCGCSHSESWLWESQGSASVSTGQQLCTEAGVAKYLGEIRWFRISVCGSHFRASVNNINGSFMLYCRLLGQLAFYGPNGLWVCLICQNWWNRLCLKFKESIFQWNLCEIWAVAKLMHGTFEYWLIRLNKWVRIEHWWELNLLKKQNISLLK